MMSIHHKVGIVNFYQIYRRQISAAIGRSNAYPTSLGVALQGAELIVKIMAAAAGTALDLLKAHLLTMSLAYLARGRAGMQIPEAIVAPAQPADDAVEGGLPGCLLE